MYFDIRKVDIENYGLEASLVYIVSSRQVQTTWKDPVSKDKDKKVLFFKIKRTWSI